MVVGDNGGGTDVKLEAAEDHDVSFYSVSEHGDGNGSGDNQGRRNHHGGSG